MDFYMYLIHLKILSVKNYFRLRNKIYITIYMKLKLLEIVLIIVLIVILLNINKQNNVMLRPNRPVLNNITKMGPTISKIPVVLADQSPFLILSAILLSP